MKESFKKVIVEWLERKIPDLIEREITVKITDDILAIVGPRRVGKTYLIFQIIKSLLNKLDKEEILFIDFEDNRLVGLQPRELDEIFVAHKELTTKEVKFLFFDEVQALPSWSNFVRKLHNQQKYKIILSGSSAKLLGREIATELRGRYKSILVLPFSFKEFLKLKQFVYSPRTEYSEKKGALLKLFREYLELGGYPEIIKEEDFSERKNKLKSYFETVFYKDLVERHKVTNYQVLEQMMNYFLDNYAMVFSVTQFEKVLKETGTPISKKTISLYLKYLEEAFFIYSLEEFSYSAKKRLMRPKKVYVIDNGLISFLSSKFSPDKGKLLENCALLELKRREKEVFYFKGKQECDFIIKEGQKISQVIQVCYELNGQNKKREIKGLIEAMNYFNLKEGVLLTFDQEKSLMLDTKKIKILPVWKWLLETE